ncbi:MAG: UDP-3-O-acyl-N-acetylglucosamine deacetylase [Armatimonadota bacterium]|nr:UDP-3-O-acyl-N-acetylglucosamine deacetylase [Armatimonadota bacterium]
MTALALQQTIARPVTISGVGLHTGDPATARLMPAREEVGITFRRVDLPGGPEVRATLDEVVATSRGVVLGRQARIATVEHLLSAARGLGIDNLWVDLDGEELPCGDGSARVFVEAIERAGLRALDAPRRPIVLSAPVWASNGASMIVAVPADALRVTYLVTADGATLAPQIAEFHEDTETYRDIIAPARTWGLAAEVEALRAQGLARGASLATTLVIGPDGFVNEPRFPNEMARHKILDAIGDLALLGRPLRAHVVAVRAGHGLHIALAREIAERMASGGDA